MNMNIQGVLLHVLGDALGSVGVILSGLVIKVSSTHHIPCMVIVVL
jgi:Co/Zn/Cd efflux system component